MTEPSETPTPSAETPSPRPATEIRAEMLPLLRGSPEWKASAAELERAYEAEERGGVRALSIPASATREELAPVLAAAQEKLATLQHDKGSLEYKQSLSDYLALLAHDAPAATAPGAEPTAEQDCAEAEASTRIYADRLPSGETWDVEAVGELRGITRTAFGSDAGDEAWHGGIHVATAVLADIATRGLPDPVQTERTLRDLWRSDFDPQFRAATEAWNMLTPRVQASLIDRGVRDAVPFVIYMVEMGRKLYDAPGGLERLLARHEGP